LGISFDSCDKSHSSHSHLQIAPEENGGLKRRRRKTFLKKKEGEYTPST
jgi:hypothetical protein